MARFLAVGVIRFLYRLALFPWLTVMRLGHTMASQVNWLLTGMTFDDVERRNERRDELDKFVSRFKN